MGEIVASWRNCVGQRDCIYGLIVLLFYCVIYFNGTILLAWDPLNGLILLKS